MAVKNIKLKAKFMIFLIIMLPIYSAIAYADFSADVQRVYVGGTEGFDKFTSGKDTITVNVTSKFSKMAFSTSPGNPFDCVHKTNETTGKSYYECSTKTRLRTYDTAGGPKYIVLLGYSSVGISRPLFDPPYSFEYYVDLAAPNITSTIYQDTGDEGKVKIDVAINDTLSGVFKIMPGNVAMCSGIRSLKLYNNGTVLDVIDITLLKNIESPLFGECMFIGKGIQVSIPEGENYLYLAVEDNVGNIAGSKVMTIVNDQSPPIISPGFSILLADSGQELEVIAGRPRSVDMIRDIKIKIQVDDANLNTNGVTADLRSVNINPSIQTAYKKVNFACVRANNSMYDCFSPILKFDPPEAQISINVTAKDVFGKNMSATLTKTITVDSTIPVMEKIETGYCKGSECYVKQGINNITLTTAPFGSKTLERKLVTLGTGGLTADKKQVDSCRLDGSAWKCTALLDVKERKTEGQTFKLALVYPSLDDVGNEFLDKNITVKYDSVPPYSATNNVFADVEFLGADEDIGFFKEGDRISVVLKAKDDVSGVKAAYADFSKVDPKRKEKVEGSCSGTDVTTCKWDDAVMAVSTGSNIPVPITIIDHAGNNRTIVPTIEMILKVTDQAGNFFTFGSQKYSPPKIDLVTLPYFPLDKVTTWIRQELLGTSGATAIKIAFSETPACTMPGNQSENVTQSFSDIKFFRSTRHYVAGDNLLMALDLNKVNLPQDVNLSYNCQVSIITMYQGTLYAPQDLTLTLDLQTYNSQYVAGEEVKQEIERLKEDLRSTDLIDTLYEIFDWINTICDLYQAINSVIQLWIFISTVPITALEATSWGDSLALAWKGAENGAVMILEEWGGRYVEWLCAFADCSLWPKLVEGTMSDAFSDAPTKNPDGSPNSEGLTSCNNAFCNLLRMLYKGIDIYTGKEVISATGNLGGMISDDAAKAVEGSINSLGGTYYDIAKKSYVYSILLLCIPGFIYNMKQQRNIDCQYVYCLENEVVENGMHIYACKERKAYSECIFTSGQLLNLIPFSAIINAASNLIKLFAQNPLSLVGIVYSVLCSPMVVAKPSQPYQICTGTKVLTEVIQSVMNVIDFIKKFTGDDGFDPPEDYCEKIDL